MTRSSSSRATAGGPGRRSRPDGKAWQRAPKDHDDGQPSSQLVRECRQRRRAARVPEEDALGLRKNSPPEQVDQAAHRAARMYRLEQQPLRLTQAAVLAAREV